MKNLLAKIPSNLAFLCLGMSISSFFAFKIITESPSCAVIPVEILNIGERFTQKTVELTNAALPGDVYYFDDIKVNAPGDGPRMTSSGLVFRIK
jgi:hypothetical protein